ncbi:Uncharacterized protein dnm_005190 [Desulfonema magnum]|uniref:Uncharacterized protein n=1 Tax=Desulfonema magnum TaxID=45655 RepID=A0A975GKD8_9BACT|nr:Uncharacterized protein dnm_005190 [Desulfonema magnum]
MKFEIQDAISEAKFAGLQFSVSGFQFPVSSFQFPVSSFN